MSQIERPVGSQRTRTDRRVRRPSVSDLLFGTSAVLAGASIPVPVVNVNGYDVLVITASVALTVRAMRRPVDVSPGTLAAICALFAIAVVLPGGQHFAVRSALLLAALAAVTSGVVRASAVVNGFMLGAAVHALIALQGYLSNGGPRSDDRTFNAIKDWREDLDWLAGPSDGPPLIAQGFLRMQGLLGHANEFGALMAASAVLAVTSRLHSKWKLPLTGLFLGCTVLSLSRFAIVAGFVAVALLLRREHGLTSRRYRIAAVIISVPIFAYISSPLAERLLNVFDEENISGRASSGGGLESLDFLPDGIAGTWHSSPLWMMDLAGSILGTVWVLLLLGTLYSIARRQRTLYSTIVLVQLAALFVTEDRIQSPSFLGVTLASLSAFVATRTSMPSDDADVIG